MSVSYIEARETYKEQAVLSLWNKGLMPDQIEAETEMDIDKIENIIECEQNYRRADVEKELADLVAMREASRVRVV